MTGALTGKVAVVTGAAGDQGRAVVERFLRDGATVLGVDLRVGSLGDGLDDGVGELSVAEADITDPAAAGVVSEWVQARGGCDVLYNNAGLYLPGRGDGSAVDVTPEVWRRVLDVNLTGALLMIQATVPAMVASGGGVVINVGSVAGVVGSRNVAYAASKAALIGLTKSLAFTHGRQGVRCVALSLGPVDTAMMDHVRHAEASWEALLDTVPAGRAATPQEVAAWAAFLAGDEAAYANGANIVVDGGRIVGI